MTGLLWILVVGIVITLVGFVYYLVITKIQTREDYGGVKVVDPKADPHRRIALYVMLFGASWIFFTILSSATNL